MAVSYSCYGWGIYRVFSGNISYGTMTLFISLSGQLTGALNSLISLVPSAIGLTTSAGRIMDIINMKQEDYSDKEKVATLNNHYKTLGLSIDLKTFVITMQMVHLYLTMSLSKRIHMRL